MSQAQRTIHRSDTPPRTRAPYNHPIHPPPSLQPQPRPRPRPQPIQQRTYRPRGRCNSHHCRTFVGTPEQCSWDRTILARRCKHRAPRNCLRFHTVARIGLSGMWEPPHSLEYSRTLQGRGKPRERLGGRKPVAMRNCCKLRL